MKKLIIIVLSIFLVTGLIGCSKKESTDSMTKEELMDILNNKDSSDEENTSYETIETSSFDSFYEGYDVYSNQPVDWTVGYEQKNEADRRYNQFVNTLLQNSYTKNENDIISPLSLYYALGILTNGAKGHTRAELETAMGMNVDDANRYLYDLEYQFINRWGTQTHSANGLWFNTNNDLTLNQNFVNTIMKYYGNSVNSDDFKDLNKVVNNVNNWASNNTDGSIDNIISADDLSSDTPFLILNALATGSKWMIPFNGGDTKKESFTNYDASNTTVDMMHQTFEGYWYNDQAEGFFKYLENGMDFIAILPNKGVDVYDYIASGTLDDFTEIMYETCPHKEGYVDLHLTNLSFPKFTYDAEYDLKVSLQKMGLGNIFDYTTCDFTNMADGANADLLFVNNVIQKDTIFVDEKEVRAAAITAVSGGLGADAPIHDYIYHDVVFDRPFIYMIKSEGVTLFAGIVSNMNKVEIPEGYPSIRVKVDKLNLRYGHSTNDGKLSYVQANTGDTFDYDDTYYDGTYTWYHIPTYDAWIADKNGEWIEVLN